MATGVGTSAACPVSDTRPVAVSMPKTLTLPLRWLATRSHLPDESIPKPHGFSPPDDVR